jgi:mono/diheme cytochrome c family protein
MGGLFVLRFVFRLPALLALSVAASDVRAQAIGDPKQGLALAQQTCSPCHATVPEQDSSPSAQAPRFVDLADASGMTSAALLVALTTPHAGMPMFTFTEEQRGDIIAYILSLH